jgi:hypothetical protein
VGLWHRDGPSAEQIPELVTSWAGEDWRPSPREIPGPLASGVAGGETAPHSRSPSSPFEAIEGPSCRIHKADSSVIRLILIRFGGAAST